MHHRAHRVVSTSHEGLYYSLSFLLTRLASGGVLDTDVGRQMYDCAGNVRLIEGSCRRNGFRERALGASFLFLRWVDVDLNYERWAAEGEAIAGRVQQEMKAVADFQYKGDQD